MKPSYRIAELESWVRGVEEAMISATDRAAEAERERDEYKHRCKVSDGACAIAEQQRDHWMQRAKVAEAEIARRDAQAGELSSAELSRLREWVKCVEAERDKAISWHSSLLEKYNALINAPPYVFPAEAGEPDGYIFCHPSGKNFWSVSHPENAGHNGVKPFYFAAPAVRGNKHE